MNSKRALLILGISAIFALTSCSGLKTACTTNCGGGGGTGTGTLTLIVKDAPPAGLSIVDFPYGFGSISIDNSAGALTILTRESFMWDLTRLQSDSTYIASFSVPADTYKDITFISGPWNMAVQNLTGTTGTGSGGLCLNQFCSLQPPGNQQITLNSSNSSAFPLSIAANAQVALAVDFNQSNAITLSNGNVTVSFDQTGQVTPVNLSTPPKGIPSGAFDLIEDFTGKVTNVASGTVSIESGILGSTGALTQRTLVATPGSSTTFDNFDPTACPSQNLSCVKVGQIVSVDAELTTSGTLSLLEVDFLDNAAVDEVEGIVVSTDGTNQTFLMAVSDMTISSADAYLSNTGAMNGGKLIQVAMGSGPVFSVDTKGLPIPSGVLTNFASFSNLAVGQMVRVQVQANSATLANGYVEVTTSDIVLRYSRLTGTVTGTSANPVFYLDGTTLPAYLGLTGTLQAQVYTGTYYDNVADVNTDITAGSSVSVRALYLPSLTPALYVAKVRKH